MAENIEYKEVAEYAHEVAKKLRKMPKEMRWYFFDELGNRVCFNCGKMQTKDKKCGCIYGE